MGRDSDAADPQFDSANGILRNLREFTEQAKLDRFERRCSVVALYELELVPIRGNVDQAHLQAIHRRIFKKVYPWAGELRQIDIARKASYPFALIPFLQKRLDQTFAMLASENRLRGLAVGQFIERAAFYLGELNSIHPFREGNGRTLREFIRELAAEAGFTLDWSRVTQAQMYEAASLSHNLGRNSGLTAVLRSASGHAQRKRIP